MNKNLKRIVMINLIISIIMIVVAAALIIIGFTTIHNLKQPVEGDENGLARALGAIFVIILMIVLIIGASISLIPSLSMFISSIVVLKTKGQDIKKVKRQRNGVVFNNIIMFLISIALVVYGISEITRTLPTALFIILLGLVVLAIGVFESVNLKKFNSWLKEQESVEQNQIEE